MKKTKNNTLLGDGWVYDSRSPETCSKHKLEMCEKCCHPPKESKTVKHTTVNGKGLIARLKNK